MKRFTALLLVICIILSVTACSDNPDTSAKDTENIDTAAQGEDTTADENALLYADLPSGDFEKYEFRILNNISNFAYTDMTAEEMTGEAINDAIYMRNKNVEERLNITIIENLVNYDVVTSTMNTSILANDDAYDVFWNESHFVAPFAVKGQLIDINEIENLNLEKPWWNKQAVDSLSVANKSFFLVGDLHLMFNESFWMVGFNKDMLDRYQLTDPYQLVRNGTWTFEEMYKDMEAVSSDLDGNGTMDGNDQFGVTCYSGCLFPLLFGTGEKILTSDNDGIPAYEPPAERFYNVFEKIVNYFFTNYDITCMDGKTQNISQYPDGWHGVFSSGHALFYLEPIGSLKKLREMESEFGIVPYPKYDESQEEYISYIAHYAAVMGIPITNSNTARTGTIIENLCAESYGELRDAYKTTTLNFKYIRDQESSEMLDIILNSGTFELSTVFGISAISSALSTAASNGNSDISSILAKSEKSTNLTLDKTIKGILGVE